MGQGDGSLVPIRMGQENRPLVPRVRSVSVLDTRLIIKNAAALGIAGVLAKAISAVVGIVVTRYLGPGPYGDYSAAYAFVGSFILLAELGVSQLMVQEGSRNPSVLPRYFGNTLFIKTIVVILCYILMLIFMQVAGYNITVKTMIVFVGIAVCFNALNQSVYNYYQAVQKLHLAAAFQFLTTVLVAVFTITIIMNGMGVVAITFSHLSSYIIISILLYLALRKEVKPQVEIGSLPGMVRKALPFGIHRIFYYLFAQISILVLSLITSNVELGIFAAAYKLVLILIFLPSLMTSATYPALYKLGVSDTHKHQDMTEKVFKVLTAVGIAGSTLIFILAGPLVIWLYAGKFNESIPILMIVAWLLAFECMSFSLGDILTTTNRQMQRTLVQGSALILLSALILILYPRLGIYGVAYAVIIGEGYIFLSYYLLVRFGVYKIRIWRQLPLILLAAGMMAGTAWTLKEFNPIISSAMAGAVFCIVLIAFDRDFRRLGSFAFGQILKLAKIR